MVFFQMNNHESLHSPDAYKFYKVINAPARVLSIVDDGLKLPFERSLPTFWYKNNASARNNLSLVREKVNQWCRRDLLKK